MACLPIMVNTKLPKNRETVTIIEQISAYQNLSNVTAAKLHVHSVAVQYCNASMNLLPKLSLNCTGQ